jgi:hypothetical protein
LEAGAVESGVEFRIECACFQLAADGRTHLNEITDTSDFRLRLWEPAAEKAAAAAEEDERVGEEEESVTGGRGGGSLQRDREVGDVLHSVSHLHLSHLHASVSYAVERELIMAQMRVRVLEWRVGKASKEGAALNAAVKEGNAELEGTTTAQMPVRELGWRRASKEGAALKVGNEELQHLQATATSLRERLSVGKKNDTLWQLAYLEVLTLISLFSLLSLPVLSVYEEKKTQLQLAYLEMLSLLSLPVQTYKY